MSLRAQSVDAGMLPRQKQKCTRHDYRTTNHVHGFCRSLPFVISTYASGPLGVGLRSSPRTARFTKPDFAPYPRRCYQRKFLTLASDPYGQALPESRHEILPLLEGSLGRAVRGSLALEQIRVWRASRLDVGRDMKRHERWQSPKEPKRRSSSSRTLMRTAPGRRRPHLTYGGSARTASRLAFGQRHQPLVGRTSAPVTGESLSSAPPGKMSYMYDIIARG